MDLQRAIKQLMKRCRTWNHALFRERKILIISDNSIISIPLKPRLQQITLAGVSVMLVWSLYSNGRFMAYQGIIARKEIEVMRSNMENQELQQLYDSLQGEMQGMNSFMDELKKNTQTNPKDAASPKAAGAGRGEDDKQSSRSAEMLREQMAALRGKMNQKLLEHTERMEATVAATGLKLEPMLKQRGLLKTRELALKKTAKNEGIGGPYIPVGHGNQQTPDVLKQRMDYLLQLSKVMHTIPLGRPIASRHITSNFGVRTDPFTGARAMHAGVDFQGAFGTPIYATAEGRVIRAGRYGQYGNLVEITHGNGIATRYGHMNTIAVRAGQKVKRGQIVGTQGNTGRSSGTHIHYEVRLNGKAQNPVAFLRAGKNVQ